MSRYLVTLFTLALFAPIAGSAPKGREETPVFYFPVQVGAKRVYKIPDREWVEEVMAVEEKGGQTFVTVETTYSIGAKLTTVYQMSEKGLFKAVEGGTTYDPPKTVLPLPVSAKTAWEFETPGDPKERLKARAKVVGRKWSRFRPGNTSPSGWTPGTPLPDGRPSSFLSGMRPGGASRMAGGGGDVPPQVLHLGPPRNNREASMSRWLPPRRRNGPVPGGRGSKT